MQPTVVGLEYFHGLVVSICKLGTANSPHQAQSQQKSVFSYVPPLCGGDMIHRTVNQGIITTRKFLLFLCHVLNNYFPPPTRTPI